MGRRSKRRRQPILQRANSVPILGNGLMYVPAGQQQGILGQTFYGSKANIPTGQQPLFSPGIPLAPQPGVNPSGYPVSWRFPVAVNTFPVDRTLNNPDIPSFQQLRNLAKLYSGITICERAWFDMVPRMKLKIELKPEYVAAGADEKEYQAEISYFQTWFESPDKMHDQHSWLRMALREQTQIDELYIYKRRNRGGGLHALEIIAGDQFKPLLDEWGKIPQPPNYAYQQYPWGLPGEWFRADELIHYQESPAADNPYGQSRVERIILLVNQALRKQKKDLSHFTEGNIPQGMMLVPDNATWTPDQIDAFEQAWNALLAGNASQQIRMRFTQPGMKYQAFEQYGLDPTFDKFLINIAVSVYGMSMQDVAFTEDIHKSSGDSQQNVTYRRTIDPLAVIYASFFTQTMNTDFDPDLHGDMFMASFGGYDEEEDISELATAYSTLTNSGILGITNAGKMLKLPDDPNAPYIGRILVTKDGPVFLDDMASDKMRNAAMQAQLAGFQQASNTQPSQSAEAPGQSPTNQAQPDKGNEGEAESQNQQKQEQPSSDASSPAQNTKPTPPPTEQEQPSPEDKEREQEIDTLMKQDQEAPFSPLERFNFESIERHEPGGHDHDQKTHGDHAHPDYGAKHDKDPQDRQAMQEEAKLQSAQDKVDAARQALRNATTPQEKAQAQASLDQAKTGLQNVKDEIRGINKQRADENKQAKAEAKQEKAEEQAKVKEEKAKAAAEKKAEAAQLRADKQKAHLQKQAAAAQAKATRMAATAQRKAQVAAAKAARTAAKTAKAQAHTQLKAAKAQAKAARALQSLTKTIGAKATLYNALSGRKLSKTWSAQDAQEAHTIASDLHQLLEMVNSHSNEENATGLMQNLTQSIGELQGQHGMTSARASVLEKLSSRIQQQMALSRSMYTYDDDFFDYDIDLDFDDDRFDEEEWSDEAEDETTAPEPQEDRYTLSELLQLLTQQMQAQTTDKTHGGDSLRSEETRVAAIEVATAPRITTTGNASEDYRRWRSRAIDDVKAQRKMRPFTSDVIPTGIHARIAQELDECKTVGAVTVVFNRARGIEDIHSSKEREPVIASHEDLAKRIHDVFHEVTQRGQSTLTTMEEQ